MQVIAQKRKAILLKGQFVPGKMAAHQTQGNTNLRFLPTPSNHYVWDKSCLVTILDVWKRWAFVQSMLMNILSADVDAQIKTQFVEYCRSWVYTCSILRPLKYTNMSYIERRCIVIESRFVHETPLFVRFHSF